MIQADSMSEPSAGKLVFLETFGCQMNELDSQLVASQLRALGYGFTAEWMKADVILYNTCSVRDQAENKVRSRLGILAQHKRERPGFVLGVLGCMAERDGAEMLKRNPHVDILCGPAELDKLPLLIDNVMRTAQKAVALQGNSSRRSATLAAAEDSLELLDLSRSFSPTDQVGGGRSAYVRVTRGCNKFCTYCVVPFTRGAEVHRPPDAIVEECRRLVDEGVREITLLGQTVNHYRFEHDAAVQINGVTQPQKGRSFAGGHDRDPLGGSAQVTTFAKLLRRVHDEVPDLPRLRFVTSYPRDFGDDVLETIRECPRICRYLHVPAQSGSNRILALMNRGYSVEEYRDFVVRIRKFLPDAQIAGDIIVGFPTETDADFEATMDLVRWARYKNCFIFKYSPRPGTTAYDRLADDVPDHVKRERNTRMLALQAEISRQVHQGQIGSEHAVFVEGISSWEGKASKIAEHALANGAKTNGTHDHGHSHEEEGEDNGCCSTPAQVTLTINGSATKGDHGANAAVCSAVIEERETDTGSRTVQLTARTPTDLIVVFDAPAEEAEGMIGSIQRVKITGATALTLYGERGN